MKKSIFALMCSMFLWSTLFLVNVYAKEAGSKPIELKVSYPSPTKSESHQVAWLPFKEVVEKRSGGSMMVTLYPAGALGKLKDQYDLAIRGVADISWGSYSMMPGRFDLVMCHTLPINITSAAVSIRLIKHMQKKYPKQFDEMHRGVKSLFILCESGAPIHLKNPAHNLNDLKGRKIACNPGTKDSVAALGSSPIIMDANDYYLALERGVVDGVAIPLIGADVRHIAEVTKFTLDVHLSGPAFFIVMNPNTFNRLNPEQQAIVTEEIDRLWAEYAKVVDNLNADVKKKWKEEGHEFYTPSPEDWQKWQQRFQPALDMWVEKTAAKGLPAQDYLNEALNFLKTMK